MNTEFPSKNWKAWHDFMPGSAPTLHVAVEVTVPTSGYTAKLEPAMPQGINPSIYLLNLVVISPEPGEIVLPTFTDLPVNYSEDTSNPYTSVQILPENITVDVEIVR